VIFVNQGPSCNRGENFRGLPVKAISNSKVLLLNLVKSVENSRNIKKCNSNFVEFLVKNPTTFVIVA
jgi:hypothetical protein